MGLTRFKGRDGLDGPVSGAIQQWHFFITSQTGAQTVTRIVQPPTGMQILITHAHFTAAAIGATPSLAITGASTVVAAVTCTTALGALTIVNGAVNATSPLQVAITTTASDTLTGGNLTLTGYVTAAPTTLRQGTGTTAAGTVSAYR